VTVHAATAWPTNAHLIQAAAALGYLQREWPTMDVTYGLGTFWARWRPDHLIAHDIRGDGIDFRHLPEGDGTVHALVLDGPYKLNGTPNPDIDERYGTDEPATWQDRITLICDGIIEAARVVDDHGMLLLKCQDQVVSGQVRWQTHIFAAYAQAQGFGLVDSLLKLGSRPQPPNRRQVHARRNYSTLLVFRKEW
jgi:hypothetical protein